MILQMKAIFNYLSLSDCRRFYLKSYSPLKTVEIDFDHLSPRGKRAYCLLLQIIIEVFEGM